jgi:Fe2+ transport system protein FeoA
VVGFSANLSGERKAHLQSYGMMPGTSVRVVQNSPATIIQVEQLGLGQDPDLAPAVWVNS